MTTHYHHVNFFNGCGSHLFLMDSSQKFSDHQKYLENNYTKIECNPNKSTLDNNPPPLLNLKSLLRPQGQIIDVKCGKRQ